MRKSCSVLILILTLTLSPTAFAGGNDLFSDIRTGTVFTGPSKSATGAPPSAPDAERPQTVVEAGQLSDLLRRAGYEPKLVGRHSVSVQQQLDPWSFPVIVTLSADERQLQIVLLLADVKDPERLTREKLLALMNASRRHAPSFFAYSSERKRLELFHTLENRSLTSVTLKEQIERLAALAQQSETLWSQADKSQAAEETEPQSSVAPVASSRLIGRWSAARSKQEAFALQLNRDGTFVLVYVREGKQSRSSGKFTLQGSSLQLRGKQLTLSGTVRQVSDRQFTLQLENVPSPLTFNRAS